jgi:proliferating cell nuclear antigen
MVKRKNNFVTHPDNHILEVKTTQTSAFKQAIERIANVISECCIVFQSSKRENNKKNNKSSKREKKENDHQNNSKNDGIQIVRLSEDKTILINVQMDAQNFEYFQCNEPKIVVGVDLQYLHNSLKIINDDAPIVIYMMHDNRSTLYIKCLNEYTGSTEETLIEINLMDIANHEMPLPRMEFQNRITISSDKFHNICKNLNNSSTYVEITSINNQISFRGQNENGKITMTYKDTEFSNCYQDSNLVIQGVYELRNLIYFSKCSKLCNKIHLYLKNDFPLVLSISIASLGKMYVFISPVDPVENIRQNDN